MQTVTPFLWFNDNAEEAVSHYTSVFKNSKVHEMVRYGEGGPGPAGSVMTATFQINGQEFIALNGGPAFTFTPAVSFVVKVDTQEEVDELWTWLSEGGVTNQCGWLQDKFGLSWQIIPKGLIEMLSDKDPVKSQNVMKAMLSMTKIDLPALIRAYESD